MYWNIIIMKPRNKYMKTILTYLAITIVTIIILNFSLLPYSHEITRQPHFPRAWLNDIDRCYQTFYPSTYTSFKNKSVYVLGDSYGAGQGDEFLSGDEDYGLIHKLRKSTKDNYFVYARGGYGSISAAKEPALCNTVFNDSIFFPTIPEPSKLLVLFYEGNDLINNYRHSNKLGVDRNTINKKHIIATELNSGNLSRQTEIYFPLIGVIGGRLEQLVKTPEVDNNKPVVATIQLEEKNIGISTLPQSAPVELSESEFDHSLEIFKESILYLDRLYNAPIQILYIPSVLSTYKWHEPIQIRNNFSDDELYSTLLENTSKSESTRNRIREFSSQHGFTFIDPTQHLQNAGKKSILHGPMDWKHFNSIGYQLIADYYISIE